MLFNKEAFTLVLCSALLAASDRNLARGAVTRIKGRQRDQRERALDGKGKGKGSPVTRQAYADDAFDPTGGNDITCDIKLTADIDCTSMMKTTLGQCLTLGAGATLDCNGFKVIGPGAGAAPADRKTTGILVAPQGDGDTAKIKNCEVEGFDTCVWYKDDDMVNDGAGSVPVWSDTGCPAALQCCPGREFIDGLLKIESTKLSTCNRGFRSDYAITELKDVAVVDSALFGIRPQTCSSLSLEDIYVCGSGTYDISQNGRDLNTCFITAADGTIRADSFNTVTGSDPSDCGDTEALINDLLLESAPKSADSDDLEAIGIVSCGASDICSIAI
jgi:hypothetical protein